MEHVGSSPTEGILNNCFNCGKETDNPKFCCKSCSAIHNNKINPKRSPEGKCVTCGIIIRKSRKYCKACYTELISAKDMTLGEARRRYADYHASSHFVLARNRSRKAAFGRNVCERCGYSKHVEVCHIKPISSFSDDTLLSEINRVENLIVLCPNCHWEFDHPKLIGRVR